MPWQRDEGHTWVDVTHMLAGREKKLHYMSGVHMLISERGGSYTCLVDPYADWLGEKGHILYMRLGDPYANWQLVEGHVWVVVTPFDDGREIKSYMGRGDPYTHWDKIKYKCKLCRNHSIICCWNQMSQDSSSK